MNRLLKNYKKFSSHSKGQAVDAYRLYDRDLPEYPYQVDLYGQYGVCWEKGNPTTATSERQSKAQNDFALILSSEPFLIKKIFFKNRGPKEGQQYQKLTTEKFTLTVREHQASLLVNLSDYLDTGLFLDHRPVRQWIYRDLKEGEKFLNLFCYTGSASIFAALKGAQTVNVDLSATYLNWAQENFHLNNIELAAHQFIRQSAIDYLETAPVKFFDLIFLDPPTFSNSKKMIGDFEIERDQEVFLDLAMGTLKDNGRMYFSTNKRSFKLSERMRQKYRITDLTKRSIPADFNDHKIHKCFLFQASLACEKAT